MKESPSIIYFGGAFDPIHVGHMEAIKIAREAFPKAQIILVPGAVLPASSGKVKAVETPFVDRVAMAVVACDELPNVDVSSIEEDLPSPNYTYMTLEALVSEYPGSKIAWMLGADQLAEFPRWKNPKRILELASLVVLPRPAMTAGDTFDLSKRVVSSLGFSTSLDSGQMRLDLDGAGSVYVLDRAPASVSSCEVRRLASESLRKIDGLVAASVVDYISDIGLYQDNK